MKRGTFLSMFFCLMLVITLVLSGCGKSGQEEPTAPGKVFELSWGSVGSTESPSYKHFLAPLYAWLAKESDGRIQFTFYPSEAVASAPRLYDAARTGIADVTTGLYMYNPERFPLHEVIMLPMLFEFPAAQQASLTAMALHNKYPEFQAEHDDVKVLYIYATAISHVHTNDKPIRTMEDMKGEMFIATGKWSMAATDRLGAEPEEFGPGEFYDTLAKKVTDGIIIDWEGLWAFHLNEVLTYSTEVGIYCWPIYAVMNLDTWNSMPPDLQAIFEDNAETFAALVSHNFDKDDIEFREVVNSMYLEKGDPEIYVLPDDEKARWRDAVTPVWDQWVSEVDAKGYAGQAILNDVLELAKQYKYSGFDQKSEDTLSEWRALVD